MASSTSIFRLWHLFPCKTGHGWLNWLLVFVPLTVIFYFLHLSPALIFLSAALGIAPMAGVLGESTGALAGYAGPVAGGLLNASLGNATEFIIALFALHSGHIRVVKASLSGSIIGNLLLVLGLSIIAGGAKYDVLKFAKSATSNNSTMLMIAVAGLVMPAVFNLTVYGTLAHTSPALERLSIWTSVILVLLYCCNLLFVFWTHRKLLGGPAPAHEIPSMSLRRALLALAGATVTIAVLSEILVSQIEPVTHILGMTELFVGVVVIAIIGNAAENSTAILMASRNKMDLAVSIATGSSTQIALLVAPVLVFVSALFGHPMTLVFNGFEIVAIILSVLVVEMISSDGETNWFEGAQLLAVYAIVAVAFYFVPEQ
jgi:Ca2+:H+ antiporter